MHTLTRTIGRGASRLTRLGFVPGIVAATLLVVGAGAQDPQDPVAATRATLEKWVEARGLVSKEKRDWTLGKETLRDRIDVQTREIVTLKKRIAEAEASIAAADKKHEELAAEAALRKATEGKLLEQVVALEKRTLDLLPRLPEPLLEKIKPVSQLLPTTPAESKQRLDERYRNVLYVCKQIHKWNREITMTSEVRTLPNGSSVEVTVVYVGIGQGYYAGAKGTVAGTGTATATGWVWTPANDLAADITAAIAILKNEDVARFVRLPVQIL